MPEKLSVEIVPIDSLSPDPANPRKHSEANMSAIRASLKRFGQQKPIVVSPEGIILAGNGTYQAAKELEWKEIAVVRSGLVGVEATAFRIADNRSAELASWDYETLGDLLRSMKEEQAPISDLGWDEFELQSLIDAEFGKNPDAKDLWKGMPEFTQKDATAFRTIIVHLKDEAALIKFAGLVDQTFTEDTKYIWFPRVERESAVDKNYSADS